MRAILTGAARGIGKATARLLADEGWDLLLTDSNAAVQEVASALAAGGRRVEAEIVELRDELSGEHLVRTAQERLGGLDGLVNNAAVGPQLRFQDTTRSHVDLVMGVNFDAVRRLCFAAVPVLIAGGGGSIVNVASIAGLLGFGGLSTYAASKGAVIAFSRTLAVEFGPRGVRCNTIAPGPTLSEALTSSLTEQQKADRLARIPLNRFAEPDDIAQVIAFLLSSRSRHITGQVLAVDGGTSALGVL